MCQWVLAPGSKLTISAAELRRRLLRDDRRLENATGKVGSGAGEVAAEPHSMIFMRSPPRSWQPATSEPHCQAPGSTHERRPDSRFLGLAPATVPCDDETDGLRLAGISRCRHATATVPAAAPWKRQSGGQHHGKSRRRKTHGTEMHRHCRSLRQRKNHTSRSHPRPHRRDPPTKSGLFRQHRLRSFAGSQGARHERRGEFRHDRLHGRQSDLRRLPGLDRVRLRGGAGAGRPAISRSSWRKPTPRRFPPCS